MLLKNKKVFIIGGSGLIGKQIIKTFLSNGAKVLNLDLKKIPIKNSRYNFKSFNCSDLNSMDNNFDQINIDQNMIGEQSSFLQDGMNVIINILY